MTTMKEYTWYLFDVDGTLIDTTELIYQCFLYSCKKFANMDIDRALVMQYTGIPLRKQFEVYLGPLSNDRAEEVAAGHMEYQLSIYQNHLKLFPHVKETLQHLIAQNKHCAVVTSRMPKTLDLYLKELGIYDCFEVLISPLDTQQHKPHPQPALEALRRMGADKKPSIMIGDSVFDIQCGQAAGVDTALITWDGTMPDIKSINPTFLINDIREIL